MNLVEKIDYSFNRVTGETVTRSRMKKASDVNGKITLQLHDAATGDLVQEVSSHNIAMDHIARAGAIQNVLYGLTNTKRSSSSGLAYTSAFGNYTSIALTDWDKPEQNYTPFVCGHVIGTGALTSTAHSTSNTLRGAHNTIESSVDFTDDGKLRARFVYDWPTTHANGTIKSVWLHGHTPYVGAIATTPDRPTFFPNLTFGDISTTVNEDYIYYFKKAGQGDTSVSQHWMILTFDARTRKYLNSVTLDDPGFNTSYDYTAYKRPGGGWVVLHYQYSSTPRIYTFGETGESLTSITDVAAKVRAQSTPDGTNYNTYSSHTQGGCATYLQDHDLFLIAAYQQSGSTYKTYFLFLNPETGDIVHTRDMTSFVNRYVPANKQFMGLITLASGRNSDGKIFRVQIYDRLSTTSLYDMGVYMTDDFQFHYVGNASDVAATYYSCGRRALSNGISPVTSSVTGELTVMHKCSPSVGTHTLLPAPVVKENTHTLKVVYEVVIDMIPSLDPSGFYDMLEEQFTQV